LKKLAWLLMICILVVMFLNGCKKESSAKSEDYEIGPDRFPSMTFVLGEREQTGYEEKDGKLKYKYKTEEDGYMDVYEYMSYLIDNCGGVVTVALNEGEKGKCEIAMESEEEGYVVKMEFDYLPDEYSVQISRVAGKLKKEIQ